MGGFKTCKKYTKKIFKKKLVQVFVQYFTHHKDRLYRYHSPKELRSRLAHYTLFNIRSQDQWN